MELILGEDERVIGHRDYARQKKLMGFKRSYSLTLTNKRPVHVETLKHGVVRKDFALDQIKGVEVSNERSVNMLNIIIAICAALLGIVILISTISSGITGVIGFIVMPVIAVIFLISAYGPTSLNIHIYIDAAMPLIGLSGNKKSRRFHKGGIKVKANTQACQEIAATISRTVLANGKK